MKRNKWGFAAVVTATFVAAGLLVTLAGAQSTQVSVTGFVTDTLSGRRGANELHGDASKRNVAAGMGCTPSTMRPQRNYTSCSPRQRARPMWANA